jgi:hypothetical protein
METTRRTNRTTQELPVIPMADMMAEIGGFNPRPLPNLCSYATECAKTQHEMPAIQEAC